MLEKELLSAVDDLDEQSASWLRRQGVPDIALNTSPGPVGVAAIEKFSMGFFEFAEYGGGPGSVSFGTIGTDPMIGLAGVVAENISTDSEWPPAVDIIEGMSASDRQMANIPSDLEWSYDDDGGVQKRIDECTDLLIANWADVLRIARQLLLDWRENAVWGAENLKKGNAGKTAS